MTLILLIEVGAGASGLFLSADHLADFTHHPRASRIGGLASAGVNAGLGALLLKADDTTFGALHLGLAGLNLVTFLVSWAVYPQDTTVPAPDDFGRPIDDPWPSRDRRMSNASLLTIAAFTF